MNEAQANAIYNLLIQHAGADEWQRQEFAYHQTQAERCREFRFQGSLGFGGKFYRDLDRGGPTGERWRVGAYPEDLHHRPTRQIAIATTNAALAALQAEQEKVP